MNATHPLLLLQATPLALLLTAAQPVFAQRFAVTNIAVPGVTALSVSALNNNGDVAGYCFTPSSQQHAIRWSGGTGVDLGTLGGSTSVGNSLNNFGQVAGYAASVGDAEYHGFFAIGQTMFDLGTLGGGVSSANSISDAGHITGYSLVSSLSVDSHAFLTVNGGLMRDLGTLGGSSSSGTAVNNLGQVAGDATIPGDSENHAFLYRNGIMQDLGTLGGTYSSASALNDAGQVAGDSSLAGEAEWHAFLHSGGQMQDLGTLGGTYSTAYGINAAGQVVGDSTTAGDSEYHGALFSNGAAIDLGTLGGHFSCAWALNNHGQVVGVSSNANGQVHGFLWQDGGMLDVNSILPANSGWEITSAYFINDAGQIVGQGYYQGQLEWYQLTPQAGNQPPVADAGPDQTVGCSGLATLDGSSSQDPDGDALSYEWREGGVSLGTTAQLNVTLALGSHTLTLQVTDSQGAAAEDTVVVVVADLSAPTLVCPPARSVPADEHGLALMPNLLAELVATDDCATADSLLKTQTPAAGTSVACGAYSITLRVVDPSGNEATCAVPFTVSDTTPPVLLVPEEILRRARTNCMGVVPAVPYRVRDNCTPGDQIVVTQDLAPGTLVETGTHEIHVTATDLAGNVTRRTVILRVADRCRPRISSLSVSTAELRPANHQMIGVTLTAEATDNCDPSPVCRVVCVTSSEPVRGQSDNTGPDWEITGSMSVALRAEVASSTQARVYTILVSCTDRSGNTSYRKALVRVPRNKNSE